MYVYACVCTCLSSLSVFHFHCLTLSFVCVICTVCLTFFGLLLSSFVGLFIHSDVLANALATVMFVLVSVPLLKVCEHV